MQSGVIRQAMAAGYILLLPCAWGQAPLIQYRAIVNAASYMPQGLPGGGVAQGSLFSLFGTGLGPAQGVQQSGFPLARTLGGASIAITQGTVTVNAIPVYVSSTQINAIMPSNAPPGSASLRVTVNNTKSNPLPVRIATSAFGIFAANSAGIGPGILQNFVSPAALPINAPSITAKPGQTIILWGTGLGPVTGGDDVAPPVGNLSVKAEVFVGGQSASVAYSGRAPGFPGTDQINFVVPQNAPPGCWVPVYVRTNGTNVSNVVTMSIDANGNTCSDPVNPLAGTLVSGGKAGMFVALRSKIREDIGTLAPVDVGSDIAGYGFYAQPASLFAFNSAASLPPQGTCTSYTGTGDLLGGDLPPALQPSGGTVLNAGGSPTLAGPNGLQTLASLVPDFLLTYLGGSVGGATFMKPFLDPGDYTLNGPGGSDVGPIQAKLTAPQPLSWTNRDQLVTIDRSKPLTINWSGGTSGDVIGILGVSEDLPSNSSAAFLCLAQPGAASFAVPPDLMANFPATQQFVLNSKSVIYLISAPRSAIAAMTAKGLDAGVAAFTYVQGKTVIFQ